MIVLVPRGCVIYFCAERLRDCFCFKRLHDLFCAKGLRNLFLR